MAKPTVVFAVDAMSVPARSASATIAPSSFAPLAAGRTSVPFSSKPGA
jgi:hypothetical protein